jgi:hypothetical protein
MNIHDLYSKRNKKPVDGLTYDELPEKLKVQIVHLWTNFFAQLKEDYRKQIWKAIHSILSVEFGKKTLLDDDFQRFCDSYRVEFYFEKQATLDDSLDIIEIVFKFMIKAKELYRQRNYHELQLCCEPEQAIKDLNTRFLENAVGFALEQGKIIRLDNELLHKEATIPAFNLLNSITFKNANDEFLSAHEHFRFKRNKECLTDCLKTMETIMKIICSENGWTYKQNDTAKTLIDICFKNMLIPDYLQTQFSSIRAVLESGIPTFRNKLGGHGQGTQKIKVPDHFANYMLHLTATTVHFLISCQKEIKPVI